MPLPVRSGLLLLGLVGCSPGEPPTGGSHADHDHAAHADHAAPASTAADAHDAPGATAVLTLNQGAKWPMDEHTRTSYGTIRALVETAELTSPQDAATLSAAIDGELATLIAGCTMTGPAHDQLHVFLTSFMPAVKSLGEAPDTAQARSRLEELRRQVAQYDAHFE